VLEATLRVARSGETGDPPEPAPSVLRPFLRFRRLPAAALDAARRALDDDVFRARVLASFDDEELDEPARLLLERPTGWADRLVELEAELDARAAADAVAREEQKASRRLARTEAALAARQVEVDELRAQLTDERAERRGLEQRLAASDDELERLTAERARALQSLQEANQKLARRAEQVRDLTTRLEEAQRAAPGGSGQPGTGPGALGAEGASGAGPSAAAGPSGAVPLVDEPPGGSASVAAVEETRTGPASAVEGAGPTSIPSSPGIELGAVGEAVAAASTAAAALARALEDAAAALRSAEATTAGAGEPRSTVETPAPVGVAPVAPGQVRVRPRRRPVRLTLGHVDDTVGAAEHLARQPGMTLLVDGYNVSKSGWPDLELGLQRRRLVDAVEAFGARTGVEAVVVFDGADRELTAAASRTRSVRVVFSPAGVEADDVVLELVDQLPVSRPVTVVSSDRRVRDGARERGANVLASDAFLGALRH
jgi:predicted RNA-binding protein with PIN domain